MSARSLFRSRRLRFAVSIVSVAAIAGAAIISLWWHRGSAEFPPEMFPEGLSVALQEDIAFARQRIERAPSAGSWGALGELCMAHELLPQAEWCFRQASVLAPDDPRWIYLLGVMAEDVDLRQAIARFDRVLSLDRSVAAVHYRRGRALARVGRFEDAEQSLVTAGDMSEQHPLVLKALAQLRIMQGDGDAARVFIQQAVNDRRAGPDIVEEAKRLLARQPHQNLTSITPPSAADSAGPQTTQLLPEPWMDGVARRLPRNAEVATQASALASQQHYKAALEMYERLIRIEDRNSRAHNFHAMVLMNTGNVQQALAEIRTVCEEFPQDALAFSSRGAIEARMGNFSAAIESLQEAVRLKPDFADAHRALLMIFQLQGLTEQADAQFRILLALVPADQELKERYSVFLRDHHRQQELK
jgi:Flp pilus assembly protein TadD